MTDKKRTRGFAAAMVLALGIIAGCMPVSAVEKENSTVQNDREPELLGGGYAATGQIEDMDYMAVMYDAGNGLPTSESNCVLGASDGYVWVGGYSGVFRYDGTVFERIPASTGLTNGRGMYEDSRGRLWFATNDNGIVIKDGNEYIRYSKEDGLRSSSGRDFIEDNDGNVYIATTSGVAYVDRGMELHVVDDERINDERILRLVSDTAGSVYGQTKTGSVFRLSGGEIVEFYTSSELGIEEITTILADPKRPGKIYFGTDSPYIYYGTFGGGVEQLTRIKASRARGVHWMSYDCGRIWVSSESVLGYLTPEREFVVLDNLPINDSIEMMTSDYQGNMWVSSSRQGLMKIVANNYQNYTGNAGMADEVVNAVWKKGDDLYVGTDAGLKIVHQDNRAIQNRLTAYIGIGRVRDILEDRSGNLWISTFSGGHGLVCYGEDGSITDYTTAEGMPGNEIRCTYEARDGSILVGTNDGVAVIKGGKVTRTYSSAEGIRNTVILTVCEGDNGEILAGSDGDGLYICDGNGVRRSEQGFTSDVIMKIRKDEDRGLYWIITSNSIEYMLDGEVMNVTTFPYNNVFDIFSDGQSYCWVTCSQGIYVVRTDELINDTVKEFRLFTMANGLTSIPVSHSQDILR